MDNIDDMMGDLEEREKGRVSSSAAKSEDVDALYEEEGHGEGMTGDSRVQRKVFVGTIEHFYDKLNVAAIRLTGDVKIGDTIEIDEGEEVVKLKVSSMQINRENVEAASEGDDVGIETDIRVSRGSKVYVLK